MLDRFFVFFMWILSLIAAVFLTILIGNIQGKYQEKDRRASNVGERELQLLDNHRFFLLNTLSNENIEYKDSAVINYGLKVIQSLEETLTLSPYQQVRDTASNLQNQYFQRFSMLKDRVVEMQFETGDIIVRHNNDFHSELSRSLSIGEKKYSHAGILDYVSPDSIMVYHAIASDFTGAGGIEDVRIYQFIPRGDFDIAVYRLDFPQEKRTAVLNKIKELQERNIPFDRTFNTSDTNELYCAELLCFAINSVVEKDYIKPTGTFLERPIYTIEDCYNIPNIKLVYCREGSTTN